MNKYPPLKSQNLSTVIAVLRQIIKLRNSEDVGDFTNLTQVFLQGRLTARQPSASNDVLATDRLGDFFPDDGYLYILVNVSGTAVWRRITMGSW